jgi:NhaP-type Na+/H+ or K+/H+ antiporter
MGEHLVLAVTVVGLLGVGAQWLAWRVNLPAIVLMSIAGLLVGPVLGILNPSEDFGDFYQPIISLAVAVILFEGGLQLNFRELRGLERGILRLVLVGGPLAWIFGALAAHHIAGLEWPTAIVFAGIMIVTGPTVIIPLLRQAKLSSRPAAILKWEGIINDPIGALCAVVAFEFFLAREAHHLTNFQMFGSLLIGTILCTLCGVAIGFGLARAFRNGWVPEYLKSPVLLTAVLLAFVLANLLQPEGGLLSVTAMGVTMANAKMPSIIQIRHFKENIAILFVAGVFVLLTANLSWEVLGQLNQPLILFVIVMLFVVRPASVLLSTIGTGLSWSERLLVSWIAPRGIVAVAVSGLFAEHMIHEGAFEDGAIMVPLAFAMVFATVVLHGFTIGPIGKLLGLASKSAPGVLIVGASPWSIQLAQKIRDLNIPVLLADPNYRSLRGARNEGIPTYYGEILSEVTEHHVEFVRYGYLLAVSGNEAHNALVCTNLAPELNRAMTYQLSPRGREENRRAVSYALQGRTFLGASIGLENLLRWHWAGWQFQFTKLSETYGPEAYLDSLPENALLVMIQRKNTLLFETDEVPLKPHIGDRVLAYVPPEEQTPGTKHEASDDSKSVKDIEAQKEEAIDRVSP